MWPVWLAHGTEFEAASPFPVIALITEWQDASGKLEKRIKAPIWAIRCAWAGRFVCCATGLWRARSMVKTKSSNAIVTVTKLTTLLAALEDKGLVVSGAGASDRFVRNGRVAEGRPERASVVCWLPVPSGIYLVPAYRPSFVYIPLSGGNRQQGQSMKLCDFDVGLDQPFFLIAGPCTAESLELCIDVAGQMKEVCARLGVPYIFQGFLRQGQSQFR